MTGEGLRVGQLVRSRAGRDAGRFFLVVGIKSSQMVAVADGKLRRIARPKIKNAKHLEVFSVTLTDAQARFAAPSVVTDRAVAEAIRQLLAELGLPEPPTAAGWGGPGTSPAGGGEEPEEDATGYGQERRDRG